MTRDKIVVKTIIGDLGMAIGFTCKICSEVQEVSIYENPIFPICDKCLNDLKEFVLDKRAKQQQTLNK